VEASDTVSTSALLKEYDVSTEFLALVREVSLVERLKGR
jgi:hypothetical protein